MHLPFGLTSTPRLNGPIEWTMLNHDVSLFLRCTGGFKEDCLIEQTRERLRRKETTAKPVLITDVPPPYLGHIPALHD